jgi:competence protein ComEA
MLQASSKLVIIALAAGLALGFLSALAATRLIRTTDTPVENSLAALESAPEAVPLPDNGDTPEKATASPVDLPGNSQPRPVAVSVCGAVKKPDVYRFTEGQRVHDAIQAAGGIAAGADMEDINIAAKLTDDSTLYIPFAMYSQQEGTSLVARRSASAAEMNPPRYTRSGWQYAGQPSGRTTEGKPAVQSAPPPTVAPASSSGLISLNKATSQELQQLPGIGPKTAEKIIAYREQAPFQRIEDLMEVSGIGDKKMEAVRNLVTVD